MNNQEKDTKSSNIKRAYTEGVKLTQKIKAVLIKIVLIVITIIFIVALPPVLLGVLVIYIFREILKIYAKRFRPDLGKIVTVGSTVQGVDALDKGNRTTVVLPLIFSGTIDIKKFREAILKKVNERDEHGDYRYPELQQSLFVYRGFVFWKWDKNFDIANHVICGHEKSNTLDEKGLNRLAAKLLRKPFHKLSSPWDVTLFSDYKKKGSSEPRSLALLRFSHSVVDARSVVQIICNNSPSAVKMGFPELPRKSRVRRMISTAISMLLSPYQLVVGVYEGSDWNAFTCRESKDSEALYARFSDPIPISLIKNLKNKLNGTFEGVILSAYTAGLRKAMLANNVKLPFAVHGMVPQPQHGHRNNLRNLMKFGIVCMPVGIADPEERLKYIENQLSELKNGRFASQLNYLFRVAGVLPVAFLQLILKLSVYQSSIISNVTMPFKDLSYDGHVLEEFKFAAGYRPGRTWFGIASLSYGGNIQIQTNFPEASIFRRDKDAFQDGILEELQMLASIHLV